MVQSKGKEVFQLEGAQSGLVGPSVFSTVHQGASYAGPVEQHDISGLHNKARGHEKQSPPRFSITDSMEQNVAYLVAVHLKGS